jgi:hypothetical protein
MAFTIDKIAFNLDGLLINVLPKDEVEMGDTTLDPIEWLWCLVHVFCHPRCTTVPCLPPHPPLEETAKAFAVLKKQLQEQLNQHRASTMEIKEALRPQTVAQVDELRTKLQAALVALDERRAQLEGE